MTPAARMPLALVFALAAASAGCDGASSAREPRSTPPPTAEQPETAAPQAAAVAPSPSASGPKPSSAAVVAPSAAEAPAPAASAQGVVETTFDDLKFPMEKTDQFAESMLTEQVKNLFGKRIRIRGYMFPTSRRQGIKQFVLVRDNMECCFGPGAALFDCVLVTMTGDATATFSIRPIAVEGEFRLETLPGPDGRPLAIYQMAGEAVE
ncbi:MAG TPA: DUF3299 domain-containing protein [Lacipirellulaceae bacterium]|nr:DUF3299 domain-containing protein [Lacipirellulaceae bacterium]